MKIIFLDVETNGLPRDWRAPMNKVDNWPRVIQLAWAMTDEYGFILDQRVDLIKPDGWQIPNEAFWINNGFSQAKSENEGIPIAEALGHLIDAMNQVEYVVAHNMNFDYNVVGAEMIRADLRADAKKQKVCTMTISTDLMKLPGRFKGTYKFPKLEELHHFLFQEAFDGAHDALVDVMACMRCFFELINREVIIIESPKVLTINDVKDGVKV
jgi:DNA polymerase III epsilon subunit-like protein